jgi:hypothetical protein
MRFPWETKLLGKVDTRGAALDIWHECTCTTTVYIQLLTANNMQ